MLLRNKNWLFYLLSISVASFLFADITTLFLGSQLEASASLLSKGKDHLNLIPPNFSDPQLNSIIIEGNIFNSKLRGKKEEKAVLIPVAAEPPPNIQARFRLIGTSEGSPDISFAVIEDQTSKEQLLYHLNDLLLKNVRIGQIKRNNVKLVYPGGSEVLEIQLDEEKSPQTVSLLPSNPLNNAQINLNDNIGNHQGIRQLASNRWVLDRDEVTHNLDNLNQLLTQARVIPNFSDGKPDGFRVFAIVQDSFYEKIGLQNGDILERVNGIDIKDPESFLKVFQHLKDENHINLDLMRNNQKTTMNYEIR